jgi:excisionase family DNA binding protein
MNDSKFQQYGTWLTASQAADYLCLPSTAVLYQLTRRGEVPFCRLGERRLRFKRTDLDNLMEENRAQYSISSNAIQ